MHWLMWPARCAGQGSCLQQMQLHTRPRLQNTLGVRAVKARTARHRCAGSLLRRACSSRSASGHSSLSLLVPA